MTGLARGLDARPLVAAALIAFGLDTGAVAENVLTVPCYRCWKG